VGGKGLENGCTGTPAGTLKALALVAAFADPGRRVCGGTAAGARSALALVAAFADPGSRICGGAGVTPIEAVGGTSKDGCG